MLTAVILFILLGKKRVGLFQTIAAFLLVMLLCLIFSYYMLAILLCREKLDRGIIDDNESNKVTDWHRNVLLIF